MNNSQTTYTVLGLMSGSSLDGLDLALCQFWYNQRWHFKIIAAQTVSYPAKLVKQLRQAHQSSALELISLHKEYARFIAYHINRFLSDKPRPILISSHGHTIFHYPEAGINFQIGDGAVIAALTQIPVVSDFRSVDIALGGQGAPLVPIGDKMLFPQYAMLLNLGGFSNITIQQPFSAFDICPVNFALNYFARKFDMEYDYNGQLGQKGKIYKPLLDDLNTLEFYQAPAPKSLSAHWFYDTFLDRIERYKISVLDKLRTIYEHISIQLTKVINANQGTVLVTGGGARNKFLMKLIQNRSNNVIEIAPEQLIDYKEAMVFAFLGLLRWLGIPNCLSKITGAKKDSVCGSITLV